MWCRGGAELVYELRDYGRKDGAVVRPRRREDGGGGELLRKGADEPHMRARALAAAECGVAAHVHRVRCAEARPGEAVSGHDGVTPSAYPDARGLGLGSARVARSEVSRL